MLISSEKENHVSLTMEDLREPSKSSPMGSALDSSYGILLPASEMPESPPVVSVYTDVNVVPEHEKDELEKTIANLEEEIAQLRQKQRLLDEKRMLALNNIIDIKGSIRVFSRVRPILSTDRRKFKFHQPILTELEKIVVKIPGGAKEFGFDKVFPQESNQDDVFAEVKPILRSALDGHNVCVLAYGQTGTGKTFTMDGANGQPGIVPRALEELFNEVYQDEPCSHAFSMSMLEVYMGNLRDLLAQKPALKPHEASTRCNLNIQTDPKGLVEIEGLTEVQVPDIGKAKWWYNKGRRVRSTSWTHVNEASSRSHCLTRITITRVWDSGAKPETSKLWMVDLGGSERVLKTGATGQTLDEGRAINLSLSALGDVIAALRRKKGHVPYRNSKLTQILKDSLGYGSKVLMLVHVSPCEDDVAETICSLSFAKRARAVESTREIPEDLKRQREKKLAELEEQMKTAEEERHKIRDQLLKAEFLLTENNKLFSTSYGPVTTDHEEQISTPKDPNEASKTPIASLRPRVPGSLPRFMTSTVASRQRQGTSEREIVSRAKSLRLTPSSLVQLSVSQSLSYSDPPLLILTKKTRFSAIKPANINASDLKPVPLPRSKMVTSSDSNLRVTLGRHRRRNSSLI